MYEIELITSLAAFKPYTNKKSEEPILLNLLSVEIFRKAGKLTLLFYQNKALEEYLNTSKAFDEDSEFNFTIRNSIETQTENLTMSKDADIEKILNFKTKSEQQEYADDDWAETIVSEITAKNFEMADLEFHKGNDSWEEYKERIELFCIANKIADQLNSSNTTYKKRHRNI